MIIITCHFWSLSAGSSSRQGKQLELFNNGIDLTYQFRQGQGACVNSKGSVGKCTSRNACYPLYNTPANLPAWAYGSSELCSTGEGREELNGICCSTYQGPFPGIVSSVGAPARQNLAFLIYPASTVPLNLDFRQFGGQYPGGQQSGGFPGAFPGGQQTGGFPGVQQSGGFPGAFPGGQQTGGFPGSHQPGGFPGAFPGGQQTGGFPGSHQPGGFPGAFPGGQQTGGFPGSHQPGGFPGGGHQQPQPPAIEPIEAEEEEIVPSGGSTQPELSTLYSDCGTNLYGGSRVRGGLPARPGEFPWTVALFNKGRQFCGGSIISPMHILTAAHCVDQ